MTKLTIHYVDDDEEDLEFFRHAANRISSEIELFTYTKSADFLNRVEKKQISGTIIFLDINMPGKSGFEILKDIRAISEFENLPVIMYSTSKDPKTFDISRELRASLYAIKPASFLQIEDIIKKVIEIDWSNFAQENQNFILNSN